MLTDRAKSTFYEFINLMVRLMSSFLPFRGSPVYIWKRDLFYNLSAGDCFPLPDLSGFPPLISPEKDGGLLSVTSEKSSRASCRYLSCARWKLLFALLNKFVGENDMGRVAHPECLSMIELQREDIHEPSLDS